MPHRIAVFALFAVASAFQSLNSHASFDRRRFLLGSGNDDDIQRLKLGRRKPRAADAVTEAMATWKRDEPNTRATSGSEAFTRIRPTATRQLAMELPRYSEDDEWRASKSPMPEPPRSKSPVPKVAAREGASASGRERTPARPLKTARAKKSSAADAIREAQERWGE